MGENAKLVKWFIRIRIFKRCFSTFEIIGAIKLLGGRGTAGADTSHQLSLTSLASDYNIVAAVDKHHHHAAAVGR